MGCGDRAGWWTVPGSDPAAGCGSTASSGTAECQWAAGAAAAAVRHVFTVPAVTCSGRQKVCTGHVSSCCSCRQAARSTECSRWRCAHRQLAVQQQQQHCLTPGPHSAQAQLGEAGPHCPQAAATQPAALWCQGSCDLLLTASELFPPKNRTSNRAGTAIVLQLVSQSMVVISQRLCYTTTSQQYRTVSKLCTKHGHCRQLRQPNTWLTHAAAAHHQPESRRVRCGACSSSSTDSKGGST